VLPQSGQKPVVKLLPASVCRVNSRGSPEIATASRGKYAIVPNGDPVRRWQSRQWHKTVVDGAPSAMVAVSFPHWQLASMQAV
jgi:hypothetical protein